MEKHQLDGTFPALTCLRTLKCLIFWELNSQQLIWEFTPTDLLELLVSSWWYPSQRKKEPTKVPLYSTLWLYCSIGSSAQLVSGRHRFEPCHSWIFFLTPFSAIPFSAIPFITVCLWGSVCTSNHPKKLWSTHYSYLQQIWLRKCCLHMFGSDQAEKINTAH